jgi:hypothetical protein
VRDYTVRYRIIRPSDGETRWISVKSTIERDEQGELSPNFGDGRAGQAAAVLG